MSEVVKVDGTSVKAGKDGYAYVTFTTCLNAGQSVWAMVPTGNTYRFGAENPVARINGTQVVNIHVGDGTSIVFLQGDSTCETYLSSLSADANGFFVVEHDKNLTAHGCVGTNATVTVTH